MIQFNEGKGCKGIRTIKITDLKNTRSFWKSVAIIEKKGKQYVRQIIYINQGHLSTKVTPAIDYKDESVIQSEVLVVENTFAF